MVGNWQNQFFFFENHKIRSFLVFSSKNLSLSPKFVNLWSFEVGVSKTILTKKEQNK